MAYQVLARKWRPKNFKEMVGQEHVLRALVNALDEDRLHHAYLFTGTRGVGKTTIARIIAKSLNCEQGVSASPCGVCSTCQEIDEGRFVDLIEVDAASRTKVEDTRELLENVQYAPTRGRYKVYLIDEVHMLSTSSFNALLKTLEEPPAHVKFLLATTDPQKLPATVLSRCLQFNLKRMPMDQIIDHHKHILGEENIPFEDAALSLIARAADGSMRDSLSLLDQSIAFGHGKVMHADVTAMLGSISYDFIAHLIQALAANNGSELMAVVEQLAERAPDFISVLNELTTILHQLSLIKRIPDAVDESLMDKTQLEALAALLSEEDIQLFYQIGLMGKRDLPLAPNARTGFEMVMLRMLAFTPNAHGSAPSTEGSPVKKLHTQQVNHTPTAAAPVAQQLAETPESYVEKTGAENSAIDNTSIEEKRVDESLTEESLKEANQNEVSQIEEGADDAPELEVQSKLDSESDPLHTTPLNEGVEEASTPSQSDASVLPASDAPDANDHKQTLVAEPVHTYAASAEALNADAPVEHVAPNEAVKNAPEHSVQVDHEPTTSHVSRRAALRAQRQNQNAVLPVTQSPVSNIETPSPQAPTPSTPVAQVAPAERAPVIEQVSEPTLQPTVTSEEKPGVTPTPTVDAPSVIDVPTPMHPSAQSGSQAQQHSLSSQSSSDYDFTPEELAVYEEYAGMVEDSEIVGYDLALDESTAQSQHHPHSKSAQPHVASVQTTEVVAPQSPAHIAPLVEHVVNERVMEPVVKTPDEPKPEQNTAAPAVIETAPVVQTNTTEPVQEPTPASTSGQKSATESAVQRTDDTQALVWFELLERVNVDGLPRQLAENCALRARAQGRIELVLHSAHETLLSEATKKALEASLSDYLGTAHTLMVSVGDASAIGETPAERKTRLFGERHNHAVEAIMQDPNVVMMQSLFGATVDPNLIKPIQLNA